MRGAVSGEIAWIGCFMVRLHKLSSCLPVIILLFVAACGSDSGRHSRNRDPFPYYGLEEGDIIMIEISSPGLSNPWSDGTSGSSSSGEDSTDAGSGTDDTGGAGETAPYQKTMTLDAGTTAELSTNAYDFTGTRYEDFPVRWSSSDTAVATVDNTGKVTALSEGTATITAQLKMSDGTVITDTVQVMVFPSPIVDQTWMTSAKSLPQPMWDHASAVWNGYLYVAGGNSSCDGQYQDCGFTKRVFYAPINQDGSTGDFVSANPLPKTLRGHSLLAYNGYLYVIGGIVQPQFGEPPYPDSTNFETILNEKVYYSKINPDGSIGDWLETTPLSLPDDLPPEQQDKAGLFAHSAVVHNGYIYVTGGWNVELKKNVRTLLIGPINKDDGTIPNWIHNPNSDLPYDLSKHSMAAAAVNRDNYIYIIGGNSGALGSKGGTQTFHREIYYAKIADDGIPHEWKLASNILPGQLIDHAAIAVDRYLFVLGGRDKDDNWDYYNKYSQVYYYFIGDNGDLEPVKKTSSLPVPLFHHAAAADKNYATGEFRIFVTGGAGGDTVEEANRRDSVYSYLLTPNP